MNVSLEWRPTPRNPWVLVADGGRGPVMRRFGALEDAMAVWSDSRRLGRLIRAWRQKTEPTK
jgi:hypothetical protein